MTVDSGASVDFQNEVKEQIALFAQVTALADVLKSVTTSAPCLLQQLHEQLEQVQQANTVLRNQNQLLRKRHQRISGQSCSEEAAAGCEGPAEAKGAARAEPAKEVAAGCEGPADAKGAARAEPAKETSPSEQASKTSVAPPAVNESKDRAEVAAASVDAEKSEPPKGAETSPDVARESKQSVDSSAGVRRHRAPKQALAFAKSMQKGDPAAEAHGSGKSGENEKSKAELQEQAQKPDQGAEVKAADDQGKQDESVSAGAPPVQRGQVSEAKGTDRPIDEINLGTARPAQEGGLAAAKTEDEKSDAQLETQAKAKASAQSVKLTRTAKTAETSLVPVATGDDEVSLSFPPNFIWGSATAAAQIEGGAAEGGRSPSIWDTFCKQEGAIDNKETCEVACDHYHRWRSDVKLMKELSLKAYRFSISWSRMLPKGRGSPNPDALDFYGSLLNALIAAGIQPIVTLYHWDMPQCLENEYGGWRSPRVVTDFEAYAVACFEAFGDRVKMWITLNEPWCAAVCGYSSGNHAPGRTADTGREPYLVAHHMLLGHARAVRRYRAEFQDRQQGQIGITLNSYWGEASSSSEADKAAQGRYMDFQLGWFAGPVWKGDYPKSMRQRCKQRLPQFTETEKRHLKGTADFFGLNHYSTVYVKHAAQSDAVGYDADVQKDDLVDRRWEKTGGSDWNIVPWGLRHLCKYIQDEYSPRGGILITENGSAWLEDDDPKRLSRDEKRIEYLQQYLAQVHGAIQDGVDIRGYLVWSFMDNFEWDKGYKQRFGVVHVNFKTLERTVKDSGRVVAEICTTNALRIRRRLLAASDFAQPGKGDLRSADQEQPMAVLVYENADAFSDDDDFSLNVEHLSSRDEQINIGLQICGYLGYQGFVIWGNCIFFRKQAAEDLENNTQSSPGAVLIVVRLAPRQRGTHTIVPLGCSTSTTDFLRRTGWRHEPLPLDWCAVSPKVWRHALNDNFETLLAPSERGRKYHPYELMFPDIRMLQRRTGWRTPALRRSVQRLRKMLQERRAYGLLFYFDTNRVDEASLDNIMTDIFTLADPMSPIGFDHIVLVWFETIDESAHPAGPDGTGILWHDQGDQEDHHISVLQYGLSGPLEDVSRLPPEHVWRLAELLEERFPGVFQPGRTVDDQHPVIEFDSEPDEPPAFPQPSIR
mmetsp:Transcript_98686/g.287829  ORF Transcript_98686/g.287829 Transcript_98686/m.287829 type:complete len:1158 (+) Transcript_98686:104-3577(+)